MTDTDWNEYAKEELDNLVAELGLSDQQLYSEQEKQKIEKYLIDLGARSSSYGVGSPLARKFMTIAKAIGKRSNCLEPVGALAVDSDCMIIAEACNTVPFGDCRKQGYCRQPNQKCSNGVSPSKAIHAEINLLANLSLRKINPSLLMVYVTKKPCFPCLKALFAFGVEGIIYLDEQNAMKHFALQSEKCWLNIDKLYGEN